MKALAFTLALLTPIAFAQDAYQLLMRDTSFVQVDCPTEWTITAACYTSNLTLDLTRASIQASVATSNAAWLTTWQDHDGVLMRGFTLAGDTHAIAIIPGQPIFITLFTN